ncbi:hypothetical protein VKT23_012210 [Stygiomarasmius scandens]|uniref:Uncharacterized protein n=1 Tax=Marasmiellus scandens TaxID=2682957 RepID=A0ABR1JAB3_9AGAR
MGRLHTGVISTFPKYSMATAKETDTGTISGVSLSGFGSGGQLGQTQHTQYALWPLAFSGTSSSTVTGKQMPGSTLPQGQGRVKITSIALGQDHTLALADGEVFLWGLNWFAQLGYVVEREELGMGTGAHSVMFRDDDFVTGGIGTVEQIQLMPRRLVTSATTVFWG